MNVAALLLGIPPRAELCTKCGITARLVFYSKWEYDSRPAFVCTECRLYGSIDALFRDKKQCSHDPRETTGPIGMYHCPECGKMVVAGMEHPNYSLLDELE